jgi:hypothetical protein
LPCLALPYLTLSCLALPCLALPYLTLPYLAYSYPYFYPLLSSPLLFALYLLLSPFFFSLIPFPSLSSCSYFTLLPTSAPNLILFPILVLISPPNPFPSFDSFCSPYSCLIIQNFNHLISSQLSSAQIQFLFLTPRIASANLHIKAY